MVVVPCALRLIQKLSSLRLSIPADLRPGDARRAVMLQLQVRQVFLLRPVCPRPSR